MDRFTVTKPFNTRNRRLALGETVTADDLADDIMPIAERRAGRFIVGEDTKAAERAVEKAADADAPVLAPVAPPDAQPVIPAADLVAEARRKR